jgi:hypothetical protein
MVFAISSRKGAQSAALIWIDVLGRDGSSPFQICALADLERALGSGSRSTQAAHSGANEGSTMTRGVESNTPAKSESRTAV